MLIVQDAMEEKVVRAVQTALRGSRKVQITFKSEAVWDIAYLLIMLSSKIVWISDRDTRRLLTTAQSHTWNEDRDRTMTVTLTTKFNLEWFTRKMHPALEQIEAVR